MSSAKLFVGKLAWRTTEEVLRAVFSEFGTVTDSIIMRDPDTGESRGYGYVTMASRFEALSAIDGLDGQLLDGREIVVKFASGGKISPANKEHVRSFVANAGDDGVISVQGLGPCADEDRLMEVFEQFGFVVDAMIEKDEKTGCPRGSGFVTMKSAKDAKTAVDTLDGAALGGEKVRMSIVSDDPSFGRKALWFLRGLFCFA